MSLDKSKIKEIAQILNDPESIKLLQKLAGPNSPLSYDELPYGETGTQLSNLSHLQKLHNSNLVELQNIEIDGHKKLQFHISPQGKEFVNDFLII